MKTKSKILITILTLGIILIGGWWIWSTQTTQIKCSNINSMNGIDICLGSQIKAIGILECDKPNIPKKAGVHYLKFDDGTDLRFLEEYTNCEDYDAQKVEVVGKFYQCGEMDQCAGVGLIDIESVNSVK